MGDVADLGHAMFGRPIVVGLDDSDTAQRALRAALELARTLSCELVVVSAYRRVHDSKLRGARRDAPADVKWRMQGDSHVQMLLDEAREQADAAGVAFEAIAREGTPANVIVEVAAQKGAGPRDRRQPRHARQRPNPWQRPQRRLPQRAVLRADRRHGRRGRGLTRRAGAGRLSPAGAAASGAPAAPAPSRAG